MGTIRAFSPKSEHFFSIFKKGQGRPALLHPPSFMPVSVDEYVSISLNTPKYPWKCLYNVLTMPRLWTHVKCYMFNRHMKMPQVLYVSESWIWHHCICKGYTEFWIYLTQYGTICLNNTWICLNVRQYAWTWLKIAECPWICLEMSE